MDVMEKLVELILSTDLSLSYSRESDALNIADFLIAHGVTVQEMKPVDKVWYVSNVVGEVCEATITRVEYNYFTEPQEWLEVSFVSSMFGKSSERNRIDLILNKRVFLTKEEAEAHLPQPPKGE